MRGNIIRECANDVIQVKQYCRTWGIFSTFSSLTPPVKWLSNDTFSLPSSHQFHRSSRHWDIELLKWNIQRFASMYFINWSYSPDAYYVRTHGPRSPGMGIHPVKFWKRGNGLHNHPPTTQTWIGLPGNYVHLVLRMGFHSPNNVYSLPISSHD